MRDDLEAMYPEVVGMLKKAGQAVKRVWVSCPHCQKKSLVSIPDAKAALDVASFFADQGLGRPGVSEGESSGKQWTFENRVVLVSDPDEDINWEDEKIGRRSPVAAEDGEQPAA
jgi:hypothetical protein